ncbi:IclR family transcriptional regulator [Glutamicibacter sp. AOP12-B1-11]|uniref:IclR family transcriptional regulator n=1 Tax=Glutamicibacter sp. AOP12-B1-11 TaxID=3457725 RepID=UPI004034757C
MSTQSVANAIRIIECVSSSQPVGLSDLARELGLSKATALRSLSTLKELGWLEQSPPPASQWSLTFHAYAVAARTGIRGSIRDLSINHLNELQTATSETIHLCIPDARNMIVVERLDSSHTLRAFLALGTALPMHASGTGLAYLAAASRDVVDNYLSQPLEARTSSTLTESHEVLTELTRIQERGFSINVEGRSDGITSLGAAVVDAAGHPVASISVSGPTSRITEDKFTPYGKILVTAAQAISHALSGLRQH